jgi:hypothetical protein
MAEKSESEQSTTELRQKIASSRELVARDLGGLRYELDFPLKFKKTFQRNTALWIGSAIALGLLIALLRARTHKVYLSAAGKKVRFPEKKLLESGALLGALKLGMTFIQPMIVSYFAKQGAKKSKGSPPSWNR